MPNNQLNMSKSKHKYNRKKEITQKIDNITREEIERELTYYDIETNDELFELRERNMQKRLNEHERFDLYEIEDQY